MDMSVKNDYVVRNTDNYFKIKDPVSALTHFAGFVLAIAAMPLLLIRGFECSAPLSALVGFAVFGLSMTMLYGASAAYHSFNYESEKLNRILKKLDHISIFFLIAGSYTPICLTVLKGGTGNALLIAVWGLALAGTAFKAIWVYSPRWVSSVIYIAMGWSVLAVLSRLTQLLTGAAFWWLLAGGIFYTAGGVIYALKPQIFHNAWFGNHELFHCFVLAGSLCHYIMMIRYIVLY